MVDREGAQQSDIGRTDRRAEVAQCLASPEEQREAPGCAGAQPGDVRFAVQHHHADNVGVVIHRALQVADFEDDAPTCVSSGSRYRGGMPYDG
jgi:hypothetical protein